MKIFYVHHAIRAKGNPPSQADGITKLGRKEAKIIAGLFSNAKKAGKNIAAIYTSPYFRCKETARIINKKIKVPIIDDERLNEFVSGRQAEKYGITIDNEETWTDCQNRIRECIKDIVKNYSDDDIVICVTSGVNLTAFISLAYKLQPSENLPFPTVPNCSVIGFDIDKSCFED